jgi:hypothetical protein
MLNVDGALDRLQRDAQKSELEPANTSPSFFCFLSVVQVAVLTRWFTTSAMPSQSRRWCVPRFSRFWDLVSLVLEHLFVSARIFAKTSHPASRGREQCAHVRTSCRTLEYLQLAGCSKYNAEGTIVLPLQVCHKRLLVCHCATLAKNRWASSPLDSVQTLQWCCSFCSSSMCVMSTSVAGMAVNLILFDVDSFASFVSPTVAVVWRSLGWMGALPA